MIDTSDNFVNAIKSSNRRFETRIKIGNTIYTKKDINSWSYTAGSISGETFQIGSTFSNGVKIEFCSILENISELTEITIELGVATYDAAFNYVNIPPAEVGHAAVGSAKIISYTPTLYEYVAIGTFYVTSCDPDRNENKTTIEASDRFSFLEGAYVSALTYPAKIKDVALEIANMSGSVINQTNFSMLSEKMIDEPTGYTYRQALGLIAQFEAGYARFNRNNECEICQLTDPQYSVSTSEYFQKGLTKNELLYQIGGISCTVSVTSDSGTEQVTYSAGSNTGPQITLENNVMTQDLFDDIYSKLSELNFYPFTLSWRGNPALEAGDWISLTDLDGNEFKVPNLDYTLTFNGGLTATSSANTDSTAQTVASYTSPLNQTLKEFSSRIDAAGNNSVYDGIETPPTPKDGDLWFKKNGPDDEIWIYQKRDDGSYGWVLQTSTKLSDDIMEKINNATPSDEIIKTINLSEELDGKEWLKITGAKLWLTDETLIDDAIITDAMIGGLNASKINAGTLDAATIDVINLNAKALSAGIISGKNLSINLDTGAVQFQKGYIAGVNSKIRFDLDSNFFQSLDRNNNGFIVSDGTFTFYQSYIGTTGEKIGELSGDLIAENGGIILHGVGGASLSSDTYTASVDVGSAGLADGSSVKISFMGNSYFWNDLSVLGKKNAIHVTRDGARATPAYETAESYLGDIGTSTTDESNQAIIPIEELFSDTINTDYEYQVFLQSYGEGFVYVTSRDKTSFTVQSSVPNLPFVWEIKAKRRGYETDRLVLQEGLDNDLLDRAHDEGALE